MVRTETGVRPSAFPADFKQLMRLCYGTRQVLTAIHLPGSEPDPKALGRDMDSGMTLPHRNSRQPARMSFFKMFPDSPGEVLPVGGGGDSMAICTAGGPRGRRTHGTVPGLPTAYEEGRSEPRAGDRSPSFLVRFISNEYPNMA